MKSIFISALFVFFMASLCDEKESCQNFSSPTIQEEDIFSRVETIKIVKGPCGTIKYIDRIGNDFYSALDSLLKITLLPDAGCPYNPCQKYHIHRDTIIADFDYDTRTFIGIVFKDTNDYMQLLSVSEVLDSKGNHFRVNWCKD